MRPKRRLTMLLPRFVRTLCHPAGRMSLAGSIRRRECSWYLQHSDLRLTLYDECPDERYVVHEHVPQVRTEVFGRTSIVMLTVWCVGVTWSNR